MSEHADAVITPIGARLLAADIFVAGFPALLVDAIRRAHPDDACHFLHLPEAATGLAPGLAEEDARTLRASAWVDLSGGPVLLHTPDVRGRRLVLTLIDACGNTFASATPRIQMDDRREIVLVGPGWHGELSGAVLARRTHTNGVWIVCRLTAFAPADRDATRALIEQMFVASLCADEGPNLREPSCYLEPPAVTSIGEVAAMTPEGLFKRLAALGLRDREALRRTPALADLFDRMAMVSPAQSLREAFVEGLRDGFNLIRRAAAFEVSDGGWRRIGETPLPPDGALGRAAYAFAHLGRPAQEDLLCLASDTDDAGRLLTGHRGYRLHFPADELPPAEASWTLSLGARSPDCELVLRRHALRSHGELSFNSDGSLDLVVQHERPASRLTANWLPTPSGPFGLMLCLHRPTRTALAGAWRPPAVERLRANRGVRPPQTLASGEGPIF